MNECPFRIASCVVPIALDVLTIEQINRIADRYLEHSSNVGEWGDRYRRALEGWRSRGRALA